MYDLVVIGGGSGGLSVATAAAKVGARVALIEKDRLGGSCTHTACVPSKALIRAARIAHEARQAETFGIRATTSIDFAAVMGRVRAVVASFAEKKTPEALRPHGIEVFQGNPAFEAYDTVLLDGQTRIHGSRFVIATGSRPEMPFVPGLADVPHFDSDSIWGLNEFPEHLVILGGGPVGLELGQAFARLGSKVTILETADRVLAHEEAEASARIAELLTGEGLTIHAGAQLQGVSKDAGRTLVRFRLGPEHSTQELVASHLLVAAGRLANVEGLNLEAVHIHADPKSGIEVDDYLQTRAPHIYAIGDVIGHHRWTHAADREAHVVFQNAVLRLRRKMDFRAVPRTTFTDPEVASVGMTESAARELDHDVRVFHVELEVVDRARIDDQTGGFAKVVATPSGKILGATIVGPEASASLQELVFAMDHGLGLGDIATTVHPYPTYGSLAQSLARKFQSTRMERGYVQNALRWFLGYTPRTNGNGSPAGPSEETDHSAGSDHSHHAPEPADHHQAPSGH